MVEYRYELKFIINKEVADLLKKQLSLVMYKDKHSVSSQYSYDIRSLYLDDPYNNSLYEKVDGVEYRHKYRIRYYNNDSSLIHLECKYKEENMTYKESCSISKEIAEAIINHQELPLLDNDFYKKFYAEYHTRSLKPSVIVDYRRLAYTYPTSEVRITFDENIRSGKMNYDLFNPNIVTSPIFQSGEIVLEVKCNEYIPKHILDILNSYPSVRIAISKFASCRSII